MTIRVNWALIASDLKKVSDWLDANIFTARAKAPEVLRPIEHKAHREPGVLTLAEQQRAVELHCNEIRKHMATVKTLEQSYGVLNMIASMKVKHGCTNQVVAAAASLHLALYHRQAEILDRL